MAPYWYGEKFTICLQFCLQVFLRSAGVYGLELREFVIGEFLGAVFSLESEGEEFDFGVFGVEWAHWNIKL